MTSRNWKHEKLPREWAMEKVFGLCAGLSTPTAAWQRLGDCIPRWVSCSRDRCPHRQHQGQCEEHIYHKIQVLGTNSDCTWVSTDQPSPVVQQRLGFLCEMSLSITFQNILISKLSQRNEHTISVGKLYILKILCHYNPLVFLEHWEYNPPCCNFQNHCYGKERIRSEDDLTGISLQWVAEDTDSPWADTGCCCPSSRAMRALPGQLSCSSL